MRLYLKQSLPFYFKSLAFLETSILLSSHIENELYHTTDYQDIMNYNCYHSLELFLKFAILSNCKTQDGYKKTLKGFNHNLTTLFEQYKKIYIGEEFNIKHPFDFSIESYIPYEYNNGELELFKKHISRYPPKKLDQYFKYPYDKNANHTSGAYLITLEKSFLLELKNKFKEILNIIDNCQ